MLSSMNGLCDLSAVSQRELIATRKISPLELLDSCIKRIEQVNPVVNAVVATDFDVARDAARLAGSAVMNGDALGPLHGLPIGIKDLNDTAGLRTTYGSRLHANHVPDQDDGLTARLRAAGAIITAKTNTPEFGAGANTVNAVYGFTGNPFDPERICGGSSGGSAVALATSMLPLATGSDLGGSLRIPAAYCGVVGFRSTPGLFPDRDKKNAWAPLWVSGVMARSVDDLGLAASALVGQNLIDPISFPSDASLFSAFPPSELNQLKVAYSEDLGFAPMDNSIRSVFRQRCAEISSLFGQFDQADPQLQEADRIFSVLRAVGFVGEYRRVAEQSPELLGSNVVTNVEMGLQLSVADIADAMTDHTTLYRQFHRFMEDHDLLICPVTSVPPFDKAQLYPESINGEPLPNYFSWCAITYGLTLTDHPVVVLPCGLDNTGAPFGIQIVGRRNSDAQLLGIARTLEAAMSGMANCRRPIPDLSALVSAS